jgi:hypothetical protein
VTAVPAWVRAAFGLRGDGEHLPGGVTGVVRFGGLVAKQVSDASEAEWEQCTLATLPMPADVRWPRPVAASDGRWVVDGWIASEFVNGLRPVAPDWPAVIELADRFHRATATVRPPPEMLTARTHRWARGERHAFDEAAVALPPDLAAIDARLADRCRPDPHPPQFVHVDLTGNVFLDAHDVPVVLDVAVGLRTPGYAAAVVVADALVWHDAAPDLVGSLDRFGDARALVARALRFRLVTDVLAVTQSDAVGVDPARYEGIVASLVAGAGGGSSDSGPPSQPGSPMQANPGRPPGAP